MYSNLSWKEVNGKLYYITYKDLQTERGKDLLVQLRSKLRTFETDNELYFGDDAIDWYHMLDDSGMYRWSSDFSRPSNFPQEVVEGIKCGEFKLVTLCPEILNIEARINYSKELSKLYAECKSITNTAEIRYEYYTDSLSKEPLEIYRRLDKAAYDEFCKIRMEAERKLAAQEQDLFWSTATNPDNRKDIWK